METKGITKSSLDFLFKKFRMALGGWVKHIITGSAPLEGKVIDFLKLAFSCSVIEAYG